MPEATPWHQRVRSETAYENRTHSNHHHSRRLSGRRCGNPHHARPAGQGERTPARGAYLYIGGYSVPPTTLTRSARNDILFVEEVIGVGETAIADRRSSRPDVGKLAR